MRAEIRATTPDGLQRLAGALTAWVGAMPAGAAQVTAGQTIQLETCDPGAQAAIPAPAQPDLDPLMVPVVRMSTAHDILLEGSSVEFARCATTNFIDQLTVDHFMAEDDRYAAEISAIRTASAEACIHLN